MSQPYDSANSDVTTLLHRAREGDSAAFDHLIAAIYHELHRIAKGQRRRLGASDTINTTAVVHEAYAKMADAAHRAKKVVFTDRGHFLKIASRVMRDVIVDYALAQSAQKRGGPGKPDSLESVINQVPRASVLDVTEILSIHAAIQEFENIDAEAAKIAELRYFAGLTIAQTGEALNLSTATVKRRWAVARAWLYRRLSEQHS